MNWLLVFLGGGLGSIFRFGISTMIMPYSQSFPISTFLSNFLSTGLLANVVSNQNFSKDQWTWYFLAIGFCGGFSTFSTFSMENVMLYEQGKSVILATNILVSIVFSFLIFYFLIQK